MNRWKHWQRLAALAMILGLVAAACGDSDDGAGDEQPPPDATEGGEVVFGADQWPECLNPITSCFNASWASWSIFVHVFPQLMTLDADSNYEPSPVLAGEPEVTEDPFTVTYTINEDAVWDDGTPITSADIEFTWRAHLDTPDAITTTGYSLIESVDTSDPKVAVVSFSEIYSPWRDLFGGQDFLLKKDAFESTNVTADMAAMIPFSGHAWKLESWSETEAVLVRNEAFWDEEKMPILDKVIFVPQENTDAEITALQSPEGVAAIFVQAGPGIADRLTGDIRFAAGTGPGIEGLWPNHSRFPLSEKAAREALMYAIDRQAIVDALFPGFDTTLLNCAGWAPGIGPWCDDSDFADVEQDLDMAEQILTDDGWERNADGVWEKDGQEFVVEWNTVAGNVRRENVQEVVQEQVREFGIRFDIKNFPAGELFQNLLPRLNFGMGLYAQIGSPDPSKTVLYASDQIPSEENQFSGQNFTAYANEDLDPLLLESDKTLDQDTQLELVNEIGDIVREDVVWIPLYPLPNVIAYRSDIITGPIEDFRSSPLGGFANMYDWALVS